MGRGEVWAAGNRVVVALPARRRRMGQRVAPKRGELSTNSTRGETWSRRTGVMTYFEGAQPR